MEYTTALQDSPSAVAGSAGSPHLDLFGEETQVVPQLSAGLSSCQRTRGAECETTACAHRQACYQKLSEWYVRHGEYQRPDVTVSDRLDIAQRFHDPDRPWGEVIGMAQEHDLSRQTIYDIGERGALLFKPRLPGPVPCLRKLLPCEASQAEEEQEAKSLSSEEERRIRNRLILTSIFPGGVTMRPLEDILEEAPLAGRSDTTIWRLVSEAGSKARQIMAQVDYADVSLPLILVCIDETFFNRRPILFVVEPISLAICGFYISSDSDRSAQTWGPLLLLLLEDQHLNIYGVVGDAAKPYPSSVKAVLEEKGRFQEDTFHQLRDLQTLRRKLENQAYRAFAAEVKLDKQWQKEEKMETREKLDLAQAESWRVAELYDDYAEYSSWAADAFEIVDLRSGEVRDREINEWLLNETTAKMTQLDHPDVVKMSVRLDKHKGYLLTYLDWLQVQLSPLREQLHAYLDEPDLEKVVLRAVARRWRLQHEVTSMQRPSFRSALEHAEQDLAVWIQGDPFLEQWSDQVHTLLELVQRASSAVENVNSIFKPLVTRKKHFYSADTNLNFVALFVLWHNLRVFKEGKRRGRSPFDILGIDLSERDWRTLLGYPPVQ